MFIKSPVGFGAFMRLKLQLSCLVTLFIVVTAAPWARGQAIWDGGGSTANWSDNANWGATFPTDSSTLAFQFGGTLNLSPNNDLSSITATSLTFNSGAGAFMLAGNAISLSGGVTNSSSNLQTIQLGLALTANSAFNTGVSGITVSGNIDGAFGLSKTGAGTLTLNGADSYTGVTSVSAGTLVVGSNTALGTTDGGTTITTGATVILGTGVTVSGETITLNGSGDASNTGALRAGSGDASWAGNIVLGSGQGSATGTGGARLGSTGAGNLTVTGSITDSGSNFDLVVRSVTGVTGKVILSGTASTYRDTYAVVGTLALGAANALPTANTLFIGNTSNQGTATFDLNGFDQQINVLNSVTAASSNTMVVKVTNSSSTASTLTVNSGTFGGTLSGNFGIVKNGTSALTLSDAGGNATNSYTGLTTINAGSIVISKSTALGSTAAGTTVASGAALILGGSVSVGAEALSITGTGVSGNGALRAQSGTSTWAGLITLTGAAEIQVDAGAALTIDVASGDAITAANMNLTLDTAGSLTIADPITIGTGSLTKNGADTVTLSGTTPNTFTGSTTVSTGTLVLNKSSGVNALGSTAITIGNNSGGLDILQLGNSDQISNSAVLTFVGSGATAGVFQLNGKNETVSYITSSTAGAGIIEDEGGTASTLTLGFATGTQTYSGIIRDGDGVGVDGSLALAKTGAGVIVLSGANSYSGTTTISAGTIQVLSATGLGTGDGTTTTGTTVASSARLEINTGVTIANEVVTINGTGGDNNGAVRAIGGGVGTLNGQLILGSGTGSGGTRVGSIGINSVLVLGGQITDNAGGFDLAVRTDGSTGTKVVISGSGNSYRDTYIVVGTLQLDGGDDRLPTAGVVNIGNSSTTPAAVLDLNGRSQRIGGLVSTGTTTPRQVLNSAATTSVLTIDNSTAYAYTGTISGDLSIVKTGIGTETLSGTNTYTGRTSVQAGNLALSGSASIATSNWIDVASGAALSVSGLSGGSLSFAPSSGDHPISGAGSITGSLAVGGTGYISPGTTSDITDITKAGDGAGTLTITGGLTFNPSVASTVGKFTLFSSSVADKINVGGALTLNSNSEFSVVFDTGYTQAWGDTWDLIDWAGALTLNGFSTSSTANLDLPALNNGWIWSVTNFSGTGALTVSIAPEPSRALLLLLGGLAMVLRRRRK